MALGLALFPQNMKVITYNIDIRKSTHGQANIFWTFLIWANTHVYMHVLIWANTHVYMHVLIWAANTHVYMHVRFVILPVTRAFTFTRM